MLFRSKLSPKEKKELETLQIENNRYKSQLDYVAMMTDVDIPEEGDNDEQEV